MGLTSSASASGVRIKKPLLGVSSSNLLKAGRAQHLSSHLLKEASTDVVEQGADSVYTNAFSIDSKGFKITSKIKETKSYPNTGYVTDSLRALPERFAETKR